MKVMAQYPVFHDDSYLDYYKAIATKLLSELGHVHYMQMQDAVKFLRRLKNLIVENISPGEAGYLKKKKRV